MPALLGDVRANMAQAAALAMTAAERGADLLLLPEACLTGYARADVADQATLAATDVDAFAVLATAARCGGIVICAGLATACGDGINVAHVIVAPDGTLRFQRKACRASSEPGFYRAWPDARREVFVVNNVHVAIVICSEMGDPAVDASVAAAEVELVLHPSAGCLRADEVLQRPPDTATQALMAAEMRRVVEKAAAAVRRAGRSRAAANPVGFDGQVHWPGNSYIIDAAGTVCTVLPGTCWPGDMRAAIGIADLRWPD